MSDLTELHRLRDWAVNCGLGMAPVIERAVDRIDELEVEVVALRALTAHPLIRATLGMNQHHDDLMDLAERAGL